MCQASPAGTPLGRHFHQRSDDWGERALTREGEASLLLFPLHFIHLSFNTFKSFWLPATRRSSVSLLILLSRIYFKQTKQNTESSTQCSTSAERQNGAARPRVCGVGRRVPRRHPPSKQCSPRTTFRMSFMFMENMKLLFCQNEMLMASSASKLT